MIDTLFSPIPVNKSTLPVGNYFVIDNFPFPCFLNDEDGIPISFKTYSETLKEATQCQNGYVIAF